MLYRDMAAAESLLAAAVERFRHLHDPFGLGWALRTYGLALLGNADLAGASQAFGEALRLFTAAHDGSAMGMLLDDFANVATAEGDAFRAARLKGAASNLRDMSEAAVENASDAPWLRNATAMPEVTDRGAIDQAHAEGQAMSQAKRPHMRCSPTRQSSRIERFGCPRSARSSSNATVTRFRIGAD